MFVSIGDEEKLSKFLELNPHIPRDQAFVDGYDFAAYDQVGFDKKFDEVDAEDLLGPRVLHLWGGGK